MERKIHFLGILQKMCDQLVKDEGFQKVPNQQYVHDMLFESNNTLVFEKVLDLMKDRDELVELLQDFAKGLQEQNKACLEQYQTEFNEYKAQIGDGFKQCDYKFDETQAPTVIDKGERDYIDHSAHYETMIGLFVAV